MSKRSPELLVEDIWESIDKIDRYSKGMTQDNFQRDEKTIDAVVRNLEIIGEAASRMPEDFTDQHSEIEWVKIIGLRNRIVHEYASTQSQKFRFPLDRLPEFCTSRLLSYARRTP